MTVASYVQRRERMSQGCLCLCDNTEQMTKDNWNRRFSGTNILQYLVWWPHKWSLLLCNFTWRKKILMVLFFITEWVFSWTRFGTKEDRSSAIGLSFVNANRFSGADGKTEYGTILTQLSITNFSLEIQNSEASKLGERYRYLTKGGGEGRLSTA